jgi:hypothetical protein
MVYHNIEEIESAIQSLATAYPTTTELIIPPNLTHEGLTSFMGEIWCKTSLGG